MIVKALGALALASLPLASATPQTVSYSTNPAIVQVVCRTPEGTGRGTAFRISPELLVSVAHVTSIGNCSIHDRPIKVLVEDREQDFALIRLPGSEPSMKIDCGGYQWGKMYFAIGFARGLPDRRILTLAGTGQRVKLEGRREPFGLLAHNRVIPGMSGGAIVGADGRVVGLVNAYSLFFNISFSRELSDTILCR